LVLVGCARSGGNTTNADGPPASPHDAAAGTLCTGAACFAATGCGVHIRAAGVALHETPSDIPGGCDADGAVVDWTADAGVSDVWTPPTVEDDKCPAGDVRVHVLDMWSNLANPTLGDLAGRPRAVAVVDTSGTWPEYWARQDANDCGWYSVCVPATLGSFALKAIGAADGCSATPLSGHFDTTGPGSSGDIWIDYQGASGALPSDYARDPVPVGPSEFQIALGTAAPTERCDADAGPPTSPAGFVQLHMRWPWGDPSQTGFAGTACEVPKEGYATPPYPTSLKVQGVGASCGDLQATLDFQDSHCPWYTALIPSSAWAADGGSGPSITVGTSDWALQTASLALPPRPASGEIWLAYAGPPDNAPTEGVACLDYSTRTDQYRFYSSNPGPGYARCGGGSTVVVDPCNPPSAIGYSTVHFRYLWAGQKTFTFFPSAAFMPKWIILEVNADQITCFREADRPWFNCQVPNTDFHAGATWRADDKTHNPEWNTVQQRPFATTPGEYWLRWDYGKPDTTSGEFRIFDYYPDGSEGDWSATGNWNDGACAPKPPPSPVRVGYGYGGGFPYQSTGYAYPFGGSLAKVYSNAPAVQDLFNALVFERYEIWKANYLETSDLVCGPGTARVRTDPPQTVSEGQGYGSPWPRRSATSRRLRPSGPSSGTTSRSPPRSTAAA
jgi:hypothetical protein